MEDNKLEINQSSTEQEEVKPESWQQFELAVKQVLSVPKSELDKHEEKRHKIKRGLQKNTD